MVVATAGDEHRVSILLSPARRRRLPATGALLGLVAIAASPSVAIAAEPASSPGPDRIYVSLPSSGSGGVSGRQVALGVRAALGDRRGEVGGRKLTLIWLDNARGGRWSRSRVERNARRAAADPRALAYVGDGNSGATAISMPIVNRAGLPHLSPVETAFALSDPARRAVLQPSGRPTRFGAMGDDRRQGAAIVNGVARDGVQRLAVVDDGELYGAGLADAIEVAARTRSITVTRYTIRRAGPRAARRTAAAVAAARPDGVAIAATPSTGGVDLARAIGRRMTKVKLFSGDALANDAVARRLGSLQGRMRLTAPAAHTDPGRKLGRALGARPSTFAVFAYNGMKALLEAADRAARNGPLTREALRSALFDERRISVGLAGPWQIGDDGAAVYGIYDAVRMARGRIVTPGAAVSRRLRVCGVRRSRVCLGGRILPARAASPTPPSPSSAIDLQAMDIETMLRMVQEQRVRLLDSQLAEQIAVVRARNEQIGKLNAALGALSRARGAWPTDAGPAVTMGSAAPDAVSAIEESYTQAGFAVVEPRAWVRADLDAEIGRLKAMVDATSNSQQMDMLRLQALTNKRNEAFEVMTSFIKKMQESRNSIIGNMR